MTAVAHLRSPQVHPSQGAAANPSRPSLSRTSSHSRGSSCSCGKACQPGRASELAHRDAAGIYTALKQLSSGSHVTAPSDWCHQAVLVCHYRAVHFR